MLLCLVLYKCYILFFWLCFYGEVNNKKCVKSKLVILFVLEMDCINVNIVFFMYMDGGILFYV